jgi:hypothetical protein
MPSWQIPLRLPTSWNWFPFNRSYPHSLQNIPIHCRNNDLDADLP